MKMENGEWKMNDTVYGVCPGLVLHEMYTVGCADLGALFLTIVTCVTVGANIVRPQHDRSLCRERPRPRLTITREHTVLPYGIDVADEFTDGGVRAECELPEGQEKPLRSASPYGTASIRTFILHFPFSIFNYSEKKNSVPLYSSGTL